MCVTLLKQFFQSKAEPAATNNKNANSVKMTATTVFYCLISITFLEENSVWKTLEMAFPSV